MKIYHLKYLEQLKKKFEEENKILSQSHLWNLKQIKLINEMLEEE